MSKPEASPTSGPYGQDDTAVHQVLHGYDHGHRMLAASCCLDDEDLRAIDRLSDASGQRAVAGNDGYLTGYPLPSGSAYALARTWYVPEATRPNVVWTHTLLLPASVFEAPTLDSLVELLRRPESSDYADFSYYQVPLEPPTSSPRGALLEDGPEPRALLARLYQPHPGRDAAWYASEPLEHRNALCLSLWNQQWPRLRRHFAFCAGALEPRRLPDRDFDLLLTPTDHGFPVPPPPTNDLLDPAVVEALAKDLIVAGPLRSFLRLCGPDSVRRRILPLLVEAFVNATADVPPGQVLERVTAQAASPTSMRRLKRALLHPDEGLLRSAEPTAVLATLISAPVARHVLADDAHLATWADRAWQMNPDAVLAGLSASSHDDAVTLNIRRATVADYTSRDLVAVVKARAEPEHLLPICRRVPALAAALLSGHHDKRWWVAWARLPDGTFTQLLSAGVPGAERDSLDAAAEALIDEPSGVARWTILRDQVGEQAIGSLLGALARSRNDVTPWRDVLSERPDLLAATLRQGISPEELAVAADIVPNAAFAVALGFDTWTRLAKTERLWRRAPRRAAVLLAAALSDDTGATDKIVANTYTLLYTVLAKDNDVAAWRLLAPVLPSKGDDWDRCRRLARGVAKKVRGVPGPVRPAIVECVPAGPARNALDAELERQDDKHRSVSLWDSLWPYTWQK